MTKLNTAKICECCMTNEKKSKNAKYCMACSEHICNIVWQRVHRVDARYKKVFKSLHTKLTKLSEEEYFLPNNVKEMIETEDIQPKKDFE